MRHSTHNAPLKALPTQFIQIDNGVILKRGCSEFQISGKGAGEILHLLWAICTSQKLTQEEICNHFSPIVRPSLTTLINQLTERRFLIESQDQDEQNFHELESHLDVFYWEFNSKAADVTATLNKTRFVILGVNYISRQLITSLESSGITNLQLVDHPLLKNLSLWGNDRSSLGTAPIFSSNGNEPIPLAEWESQTKTLPADCLITTCDFGGREIMREWNTYCMKNSLHFLPVRLQNLIGRIGPLVIPGETPCFECLIARENSHLEDPETFWKSDTVAFDGQNVTGFHPSMASMSGDLAALELIKLYSGILPRWNVGTLIEVKFLVPQMESRKILKVPRCRVCSPLKDTSSSGIIKDKGLASRLAQ